MISLKQMAYGFYDRSLFPEDMEDEARILRRDLDELHPCDPAGLPSTDFDDPREVEDELIERIDRERRREREARGKMPNATPCERAAHERTIARKRARRAAMRAAA